MIDVVRLAEAAGARRRGARCSGTMRNRSVTRIRHLVGRTCRSSPATAPTIDADDRREERDREADLQRDLAGVEHLR